VGGEVAVLWAGGRHSRFQGNTGTGQGERLQIHFPASEASGSKNSADSTGNGQVRT